MSSRMPLPPELVRPTKLYSSHEILSKDCPVPKSPGVYAWYFRNFLPFAVTADCIQYDNLRLLYIGTAPSTPVSKSNLRKRLKGHLRGNASGSTLRLSLGCLLNEKLGIQLRRVGSTERKTFHDGEKALSEWIAQNAFVIWHVCPEPWKVEHALILALSLPLNLDKNRIHPFYQELSSARDSARKIALQLPVL